jgi:hypothetical protein
MRHRRSHRLTLLLALACALPLTVPAASLRLLENGPQQHDFADLPSLPARFGEGEFTVELWIKPDARYSVGPVWRASKRQLSHWSDADPKPYANPAWWLTGNWLLDGMTRPRGYGPGDSREGSFGLQFYGGGRLRWLFADGSADMPAGMVWAVQAWPASETPSLLDDQWHHVAAVRRWHDDGARLELWVDGRAVATTDIPTRVDMRAFWHSLPHPDDPAELGGWAIGSEVMTAWDYEFNQYEDYKGLVDELRLWTRALTPDELSRHARTPTVARGDGLVARYAFDEGRGVQSRSSIAGAPMLVLHKPQAESWSPDDPTPSPAP